MLTKAEIKIVLAVVAAIVLFLVARAWLHNRDEKRDLKADAAQVQQTGRAATVIGENAGTAQNESRTIDVQLQPQRVEIIQRYEALKNEDATVRDAASVRIPAGMRELARERRLARERLSGAAPGGEVDDGGAASRR